MLLAPMVEPALSVEMIIHANVQPVGAAMSANVNIICRVPFYTVNVCQRSSS